MDNKILIILEKVFTYIFILAMVLFIIPTTIYLIHPIKDTEQSTSKATSIFWIVFFSITIVLSIYRLIKPAKVIRIIVGSLYVLIIISMTASLLIAHKYGYWTATFNRWQHHRKIWLLMTCLKLARNANRKNMISLKRRDLKYFLN